MTLKAVRGETLRLVIGRLGFAEIVQVTTHALSRQTLSIHWPNGSDFVAGITIHSRVGADQWEPVLVLADVVDGNLPTGVTMAHVALRAVFAAMNIGVAVLALLADAGEHKTGMAVSAAYLHVHAAQSEVRLLMLELRDRSDRLPALCGVAIFAGNP